MGSARAAIAWIAVVVASTAALDTARADVAIDPPVVRNCETGKSWDAITACFTKLRMTAQPLRTLANARVVQLLITQDRGPPVDGGVYFYAAHGTDWVLAGIADTRGTDFQLLAFEPIPIGPSGAYRLDIGESSFMTVQLGGIAIAGYRRSTRSMYCDGASFRHCADVMTSCEFLVRGRAYLAFRGIATLDHGLLSVTGDTSKAGPVCAGTARLSLGWTYAPPPVK